MRIVQEMSIVNFKAWAGAVETLNVIVKNNLVEEFDMLMEEIYPQGLTDTQLNDILWFEADWLYEALGMQVEEEEE